MAHKHDTRQDGRIYGKLESDETFTKRLDHINKLIQQGEPVRWYRSKHNVLKIYRNGMWYDMSKLATLELRWSVEGVDK